MSAGMRCERAKRGKEPFNVLVVSKFTTSAQIYGQGLAKKENIWHGIRHAKFTQAETGCCYLSPILGLSLAKAKPLKSQSDDNMITTSAVDMHGVDSTGKEGSVGGERSTAVIVHASAASELQPY